MQLKEGFISYENLLGNSLESGFWSLPKFYCSFNKRKICQGACMIKRPKYVPTHLFGLYIRTCLPGLARRGKCWRKMKNQSEGGVMKLHNICS